MQAIKDPVTGQCLITEEGRPVLRYNYAAVEPGPLLEQIAPGNRIYAVARSNYIHPLYGLQGEELTQDWSLDHPHHRGIYWAWPEVDWRGQRGDLHALQKVFARPTGRLLRIHGQKFAQVDAENRWLWEDRIPIVEERVTIRAWRATSAGRVVDLAFRFASIGDEVALARRGTDAYGGLNIRLNTVLDQQMAKHTDPPAAKPRRAWGEVSGRFGGAPQPSGLVIFEHASNPHYPGDWIDFPAINWLQPTFPAARTRFQLQPGEPLFLQYRLWIHPGGPASEAACLEQWRAAQATPLVNFRHAE